jgi:rRNA maturation protein Rpf1
MTSVKSARINNLASNLQAIINKSNRVRGIEDLLSNANDSGPSKRDEKSYELDNDGRLR